MGKHVIETVTFRLNDGIARDEFISAAQAVNEFVSAREGFIARRLSCGEDGLWIEHIQWDGMEAARDAAAALGAIEANRPFLSAIDQSTVAIHHTELELAVN